MVPLIQDYIVKKNQWLTKDEAIDCIALCQSLPGVIAINMATYIGHKKGGLAGSIAATLGVLTPSYAIIIVMIEFLNQFQDNIYINSFLIGIKAAAAGLIAFAAYSISRQVVNKKMDVCLVIITVIALIYFNINGIYLIILGALTGIIVGVINTYFINKNKKKQ